MTSADPARPSSRPLPTADGPTPDRSANQSDRSGPELDHPAWCDLALCSLDEAIRDGSTHRFHEAVLLDEYAGGHRHGLMVRLLQADTRAPNRQPITVDTAVYIDARHGRIEADRITDVAAALGHATELIGWPPRSTTSADGDPGPRG